MHEQHVDTLTCETAEALSRRRSLLGLGSAMLAGALAKPALVAANTTSRKARKRSKRKCKRQIDQCRDALSDICASDPECGAEELASVTACCDRLRDCHAGEAVDCLFAPFLQ